MSEEKATINGFQAVLSNFTFQLPSSFSEGFAIERYKKKFEVPNDLRTNQLVDQCWDDFFKFDSGLREIRLPPGVWYKVREFLHLSLMPIRFSRVELPRGSEFTPTAGQNSCEARLCASEWTCTADNLGRFTRVCYGHKALKRAVRNRYAQWFSSNRFDISIRQADDLLYRRFKAMGGDVGFRIFSWKLHTFCVITQGSRFATVPKNNEKRRPINVEPFGNIITQRSVGLHLRQEIKRLFNVDLDTLAAHHRQRIQHVDDIATIDCKNASDSISISLCRFLLPKHIFKVLEETRSPMLLGPDGHYHVMKKISSMGNGFTFELMTLILLAAARCYDSSATVFGDDIIINKLYARDYIDAITAVNFVVNTDKSFIEGPFRESCGGNYHIDEGYVESYDFNYPETMGDCVVIWNKVARLATKYKSFEKLEHSLGRVLPHALRGGPCPSFLELETLDLVGSGWTDNRNPEGTLDSQKLAVDVTPLFPQFFVTKKFGPKRNLDMRIVKRLKSLKLDPNDFHIVRGFEFKSELRSQTNKHLDPVRHWAKYEMYLLAGRRAKDVISGRGEWQSIWFINSGNQHFRAATLRKEWDQIQLSLAPSQI